MLEREHAVRQALQVAVRRRAGQVVEQQHGAAAAGEVLLERQDLAAVAQRTLGQQANLRQRVEHQTLRLDAGATSSTALVVSASSTSDGWNSVFWSSSAQRIGGRQLEHVDPVEGPTVRRRDHLELFLGFGQRDVDAPLAAPLSFQQELQGQRGLADPRIPFNQQQSAGGETAAQDIVQSRDTRCCK